MVHGLDPHDGIEFNLLESGSLTYLIGGQRVSIEAGQLGLFWAAVPHPTIEFKPGTEYLAATLPFPTFLRYGLPEAFVQPLLAGSLYVERERNTRLDHDLFSQWARDLHHPSGVRRDIVMLEMEARLRRLSAAAGESRAGLHIQGPDLLSFRPNKVEQMAWLVARRYTESLNVTEISKAVGLHPNYAMSVFKKAFGSTIIDYLTHLRVSHAQRLLATTDEKIVEVAFDSGFNSISRFNQAFRRTCGCSPREYRLHHDGMGSGHSRSVRMKRCG